MRLLIAEDEVDLAEALTVFFEKKHFTELFVYNYYNPIFFKAHQNLTDGVDFVSCGIETIKQVVGKGRYNDIIL